MSAGRDLVRALLPIDDHAARAFDETLADWHFEAERATTALERYRAAVDGLLGVLSVLLRTTFADLGRARTYRVGGGVIGLGLVYAMGIGPAQMPSAIQTAMAAGTGESFLLLLALVPMALTTALPLALMARAGAWSTRAGAGALGTCALLMLLAAVNVGWLAPASNQVFRERQYALLYADAPVPPGEREWPRRGAAELTIVEVIDALRFGALSTGRMEQQLHRRLMLVAMVPAALLLGIQIHRLLTRRGWRRGTVPATVLFGAALAFIVYRFGSYATPLMLGLTPALFVHRGPSLMVVWLLPAAFGAIALLIAAVERRPEKA